MNGTLTMPDGTAIPLTVIMLQTIKGQIQGTARLTPAMGAYVRQHARATGHLRLTDGRAATVRVGGVRPTTPARDQEPMEVFHFQFVEGWD